MTREEHLEWAKNKALDYESAMTKRYSLMPCNSNQSPSVSGLSESEVIARVSPDNPHLLMQGNYTTEHWIIIEELR